MLFDLDRLNRWAAKKLFSTDDRKRIWLKLAKMLDNNVPLLTAVEALRDRRAKRKGDKDFTALALKDWGMRLRSGASFADAARDWIPHQEAILLMAGEKSGQLSDAFRSACAMMETISKIKTAVFGGIAYPVLLVAGALGISYMFGTKVYPLFLKIASEEKWSGQAVYAFKFSHFVQDWLWLIVTLLVAVITVFVYSLGRWDGSLRKAADQYLPYSLYRTVIGSTWLVALASMVKAGERLEDALINMRKGSSQWLTNRINRCLAQMRLGHNMGDALQRTGDGFPDPEIIDDLGVYSSISGFDEALATLGREWSEESVAQVQKQSKVLFVVGLLVVVVLLGFLLSGLISMQLQIGDVIKAR